MIETDSRLEQLLHWFVQRFPPRVVAITVLVFYPGVALIVPTLLGFSHQWLILANAFGAFWAAAILLWWLLVQLAARDRRHLLEWTTDLRLLDAQEFEWFVGEIFRREGWAVRERGRQDAADGNVDLELAKSGERRLVQCKRWRATWVGVDEIRKFAGTLTAEKLPADAGIFVTLSRFNKHAVAEATRLGMELLDNADLHRRAEAVRRVEPCPNCSAPMVLDHSAHGWWFRCTTPSCGGKRHLDRDPGRALAILTEPPA